MAIIRKHQPNTSDWFRQSTNDAISIIGERVIYLEMFSPHRNHGIRCSHCFSDVYSQSDTSDLAGSVCPYCYGTTYQNGIYRMFYTNAIIGKPKHQDSFTDKRGYSTTLSRQAKMLWPVQPYKNDFLVRVYDWLDDGSGAVVPAKWDTYQVSSDIVIGSLQDGLNPSAGLSTNIGSVFTIHRQEDSHPLNTQGFVPQDKNLIASKQPFVYIPDYITDRTRLSVSNDVYG